ncbi:opsin family protein [Rhodotorula paludigena]|uniref:opsin family protein n=1 Tax=Rhodotorula paludigena TaxID=86838 RepID=UPI00316EC75C
MEAAADFLVKRNNVLNVNPLVANIDITTAASDWLWAVFAVMLVSAIGLLAWGHSRPIGERAFHELAAALCFTASVAYFSMASDLGATAVPVEFVRGGTLGENWVALGVTDPTRSIWYARYIDWTITTPMLLLSLVLSTGMPLSQIFGLIFFDIVMIITGLLGALTPTRYKWGFFTFGCVAMLWVFYVLMFTARKSAAVLGSDYVKAYTLSATVLAVLWFVYPIIWGVADGGNVITPTSEMVAYGVLDLLAKPVFSFIHMFQVSRLDYNRLGFGSTRMPDNAHQGLLHEKGATSQSATPRPSTVAGEGNAFHNAPASQAHAQPHVAV